MKILKYLITVLSIGSLIYFLHIRLILDREPSKNEYLLLVFPLFTNLFTSLSNWFAKKN